MKTVTKITLEVIIFLGIPAIAEIAPKQLKRVSWSRAMLLAELRTIDTLDTWAYGFVGNGEFHHVELENFEIRWFTGDTSFLANYPKNRDKIYIKRKRSLEKPDSLLVEVPMTREEIKRLNALPQRHRVK